MNLGYFDYFIIFTLIVLNIYLCRKIINSEIIWKIIISLLIPIPVISMIIEIEQVEKMQGTAMDNFELLYTFLKFPIYWTIILLQITLIWVKKVIRKYR